MIYQIYYENETGHRQVMFDIEVYISEVKENKNYGKWYVEMHSDSFVSGVVDFIVDKLDRNQKDEFKTDCEELEELRGWLWETHSNYPRTMKEASDDRTIWMEYIKDKVYTFSKKYGLYVNED